MEKKGIYKCSKCGNVVEVLDARKPPVSCCGQPMELLEMQTEDSAVEKHVPVIKETDDGIQVVVGSTLHPMEEKHHIVFIEVLTEDGQVYRADLQPGDKPEAFFPVKKQELSLVREYCNIHNLWRS